ncbi:MAG: protein kinase, partial [Proteobacteria bacterium]|nr:protein kinase [Pseudomonadota bacterium]
TMEYLGGGNSKNFLVTNVLTGNKEVLKLEYRMGNPIDQVQKLQKNAALSPYFVGVSHNRAVAIGTNRGSEIRFLQMTDFCQGDDLTSCAYKVESDVSRLISANNIYSQMAYVLVNLDANNTIHTDMKNSNWLLDEQGRLRIADTKAFVPTDKGNFSFSIARKNKYDLVTTSYLNPPEFAFNASFSASKAQAYMFGKNLYDFLSAYDYHKKSGNYNFELIKQAKNGEDLNFDAPIFSTPIGERYKQLICETVRANPDERLDMRGVQESMQAIESLLKKPEILNEYYGIRSALQRQAKSVNSTQNIRDNINYMLSVWDDKTLDPWLNDGDFTLLNKQMSLYSDMLKIFSRININSPQQDKLQVIMENFYEGKEDIASYKEAFYKIVNLEIETQASSDPVKADYIVLVNQLETVRDKGNVHEELERAARGVYEKPTTENFESINKRLAGLLSSMQPYLTHTVAHSATETTRWMKSNMQNCRQQSAANAVDASELVQPTGNKLIH